MPQRERRGRTGVARRAAAHRIHHDERRLLDGPEHAVDVLGRAQLLKADAGQLVAHRLNEAGVVHRDMDAGHRLPPYFFKNAWSAARKSGVVRLMAFTSAPRRMPSSNRNPSS